MATHAFTRIIRKALATLACTCAALAFGVAQAGGGGQPPRCNLLGPAEGTIINAGESVQYSALIDRDGPNYNVKWSYVGGDDLNADGNGNDELYEEDPVNVNGTVTTPAVFYANAGNFSGVLLATSNGNGKTCTETINIIVQGVGGNNPPNASDDFYSTAEDTPLNVAAPGVLANDSDPDAGDIVTAVAASGATTELGTYNLQTDGSFSYTPAAGFTGTDTFTYTATDDADPPLTDTAVVSIDVQQVQVTPTARGDVYATPIGKTLDVTATRVSGVLYNDFGGTGPLTAGFLDTSGTQGSVSLNADGSFIYTPPGGAMDNLVDVFTYEAQDSLGVRSGPTNVAVQIMSDQPDFKMTMNYELGMHCTGFEFAYCCVLPPYNSIVAQITKPQLDPTVQGNSAADPSRLFPRLLDATEHDGLDNLGRETVLRDLELDSTGEFKKYVVRYSHDAQPRDNGLGAPQTSSLISDAEGASLYYHDSLVDSAKEGVNKELIYGSYADGIGGAVAYGVWQGDGDLIDNTDNYANAWLNHFYIYTGVGPPLEGALNGSCIVPGSPPTATRCTADTDCNQGAGEFCSFSLESDKVRLGVLGNVEYPENVGASLQPLGPNGSGAPVVGGQVLPPFENVLTWSTNSGTVVYTQMKVLENLPVMLTSPRIWEGLGLPLTPFEDSINFFGNPGAVNEDSIRPYVSMKAQMYHFGGPLDGQPVMGSNDEPVIGFGTAPIDIPNCERCHSATALNAQGQPNINSPSYQKRACDDASESPPCTAGPQPWGDPYQTGLDLEGLTMLEYDFWLSIYGLMPGEPANDSDWYPRLKAAAINMLAVHDDENGTGFTSGFPGCGSLTDPTDTTGCGSPPSTQNNRLGFESIICQRCHADNVIANVKSGCEVEPSTSTTSPLCPDVGSAEGRQIIQPITEALHWNHRGTDEGGVVTFSDALGRDGGCQGCHPAHRSDGVTDGYPITLDGDNFEKDGDNRLASGGCFVGRDVHSNPLKDVDGAETPEYLNAVGQWLQDNVSRNQAGQGGSDVDFRGIWCTNCHNQLGQSIWAAENMVDLINGIPGKEADLTTDAVNIRALGSLGAIAAALGISEAQAIAQLDPTDGNPEGDMTHSIWNPDVVANPDATVATIEVSTSDTGCGPRFPFPVPRFGPIFACLDFDADPGGAVPIPGTGDPSVRILTFCTTPDCVAEAQLVLDAEMNGSIAAAVPFDAATDGRDHWLAPGEPHCADCHAAPYTEQSGNLNPYPPFNYPRKAALMRYSRGHQDLTCQSCHESIHGLYPVSPTIDSTSYAQAAALNPDGSHGPLTCATCHEVDENTGIPTWMDKVRYNGARIDTLDDAIGWAHTFTDNASVLQDDGVCENCHKDRRNKISETAGKWLRHSWWGRVSRQIQDKAEREALFACAVGAPNALQTCADDSDCGNEPGACVGDVAGGKYVDANTPQAIYDSVCTSCHQLNGGPDAGFQNLVDCTNTTWKNHLIQGRVAEKVWEFVSETETMSTCGW